MHWVKRIVCGLVLVRLPGIPVAEGSTHPSDLHRSSRLSPVATVGSRVILLDVDNTLYAEAQHHIEQQIIRNIYDFCATVANVTNEHADDLHHKFGSTLEGLRQTLWRTLPTEEVRRRMEQFYNKVYHGVEVKSLIGTYGMPKSLDSTGTRTGYSHRGDTSTRLLRFWKSIPPSQIHLASNSPRHHIGAVVQAMGLCKAFIGSAATALSPDSAYHKTNDLPFPSKSYPDIFFAPLDSLMIKDYMINNQIGRSHERNDAIILLDDSRATISRCASYCTCIRIDNGNIDWSKDQKTGQPCVDGVCLEDGIAYALGWLDPTYHFSEVQYLLAKNQVDKESLNKETWMKLLQELSKFATSSNGPSLINIVDLGAGLLSMLRLVLLGGGTGIPSLFQALKGYPGGTIDYYAYEPNVALRDACLNELRQLGFRQTPTAIDAPKQNENIHELCFEKYIWVGFGRMIHFRVFLRFWDYRLNLHNWQPTPHVILGCCFADLVQPNELVASLMTRFLSSTTTSGFDYSLVYFPITFGGTTQFLPSNPFEKLTGYTAWIPSDTAAFSCYSQALIEEHGHNLDPLRLQEAMEDFGATLLHKGKSSWIIDSQANHYLWETMLYFFGKVAGIHLHENGWNAAAWVDRARRKQSTIRVTNFDLLFRLPHLGKWRLPEEIPHKTKTDSESCEEIVFTAPSKVAVRTRLTPELGPNDVRIDSVASLISTGTEMKIFSGEFDDAELDTTIQGMADQRMRYPLSYGYCLVGKVVKCGTEVDDAADLIGKIVFVFAPHATQVVADRSSIQIIPDGIDPYDAIFMPSVETALSLVQDAHPRFGDTVAVFGQGLVGLLVTAILDKQFFKTVSGRFGTVTTFDSRPDRLAASVDMGSWQALLPTEAEIAGPFDVVIEVSGNGRALQDAIDSTRNGGRIIIGSWYGKDNLDLYLGIEFHRSHKQIKASQVSVLPSEMSMTWNKERRFELTWELVRQVRPSRILTRRAILAECQDVYESLRKGNEVAVAFVYSNHS